MSIRPLPPKLQETAEKELNEDSNRIKEDLQHIEEWLEKQPHLTVRKDPQFMLSFLRCSKFSRQRAKDKLDFFYTMKTLTPEYFLNKDPFHKEIQEILDNKGIFPVTKGPAEANAPTILFVRWAAFNPETVHFTNLFKAALMCLDVLLNEDDNFTVNGIQIIHDMQGFSLGYVKHLTPALCQKLVLSLQTTYPMRLKGIYFFNTPMIYEVFINMFIPFFSEKLRKRLKIFKEPEGKLNEYISLELFPDEYGGKAGPMSKINDEFRKKLENYSDWFMKDEQYGSDESKRLGKPKTSADIFGVEGSFRKLNLD